MTERQKKELSRKYPNLAEEIGGQGTVKIEAVRSSQKEADKVSYAEHGYEPTVIDYIRRCETEERALEIINFLAAKGEIDESYAKRLQVQLAERGLESFGRRKRPGYYEQSATG